jgi:hypothetical protein
MWYGKVQAGLTLTSTSGREEEEEERGGGGGGGGEGGPRCLPGLGCLATYIGYVPRASICLC